LPPAYRTTHGPEPKLGSVPWRYGTRRVFPREGKSGNDGHFWYRIGTHRFGSRNDAFAHLRHEGEGEDAPPGRASSSGGGAGAENGHAQGARRKTGRQNAGVAMWRALGDYA